MTNHFTSASEKEMLSKLQSGDMLKKKIALIKSKKKVWVEGVTHLCWQSVGSIKRINIADIAQIYSVSEIDPKHIDIPIILVLKSSEKKIEFFASNVDQANFWINGLNKCRVASRSLQSSNTQSSERPRMSQKSSTKVSNIQSKKNSGQRSDLLSMSRTTQSSRASQLSNPTIKEEPPIFATQTDRSEKLFDFVVVVQSTSETKMMPEISYTFPPSVIQKKSDQGLLKSIPSFCFPDADTLSKISKYHGSTYAFTLTDINGDRRYGYCLRMLPEGKKPRWPVTYCIISKEGCFQLFSEILSIVEKRNALNNVAVFSFLKALAVSPFPNPGESINVPVLNTISGSFENVIFTRSSADTRFEFVDFNPILKRLNPTNFLSIFLSVLLERRIIFLSKDLSILSASIHAISSCIYPFEWIQILIPVLPKSLLSYVCSPTPFLIGVLQSHLSALSSMPMEKCVIVDLDTDRIQNKEDISILPNNEGKLLKDTLHPSLPKTNMIALFKEFGHAILDDVPKFIKKNKDTCVFSVNEWINSKPAHDREFYNSISATQHFMQWATKVEQNFMKGIKMWD